MKWNPLAIFTPFLLLLFSIPLTTFAVLTTWVALGTLLLRVSIVYFELGLALVHGWIFVSSTPKDDKQRVFNPASHPNSPNRTSPTRHRRPRRNSNIASAASSSDLTMTAAHRPVKSESFVSLIGSSEANRDFEGVGGWRVSGGESEEAIWSGMNSRLQLPAIAGDRSRRHHQRSYTGGSVNGAQHQRWSWSPDALRMSPVQSRARTPNATMEAMHALEGYFAMQPQGKTGITPVTAPAETGKVTAGDVRRKSLGGSSSSSAGSAKTPKKATRQIVR